MVVTSPLWTEKVIKTEWQRPKSSGQREVDKFLSGVSNSYNQVKDMIKKGKPQYNIYTYYLETEAGQVCKAVNLKPVRGENFSSIVMEHKYCQRQLETLSKIKSDLVELPMMQASASLALPGLGFGAFSYGKIVKEGGKVFKECNDLVNEMYEEKLAETRFLESLLNGAIDIDGKQSTEKTILCPLFKDEVPPTYELQLVKNFVMK